MDKIRNALSYGSLIPLHIVSLCILLDHFRQKQSELGIIHIDLIQSDFIRLSNLVGKLDICNLRI